MAESNSAPDDDSILVRVCKFDGQEYRRWPAQLAEQAGPLVVLDAVFAEEINHDLLGRIPSGTSSREYYWLDRWYNVFRFSNRFYCNVNTPPTFDGRVLTYVDLDIDVLVEADFSYRILDLEDFTANEYPVDVEQNARRALQELIALVETRSFPFDE